MILQVLSSPLYDFYALSGCPHLVKACYPPCLAGSTSILSCQPPKADPQGGGCYHEAENSSQGRGEPQRVVLSPTLRYAGLEPFATKVQ